jgi:signal peptidase I
MYLRIVKLGEVGMKKKKSGIGGGSTTTDIQKGDKVVLKDFRHEVYGTDRPTSWHWIQDFNEMIGQSYTVDRIQPRGIARLKEVKTTAGFPFHWLTKIFELPEELFDI